MENETHNDDEPILRLDFHDDEEVDIELEGGKAEVKILNKQDAPLEETPFKVLLELEGVADDGRLGVDLVTILDISSSSSSINQIGLLKIKLAVDFLVQKLCRVDRLSVVITSNGSHAVKLCPLRQITEISRTEIVDQVNDLVAGSGTNTEAALKLALKVLNDRTLTKSRSVAILVMSNGIEDAAESQAIAVPVSEVPVHTFAFGSECYHEVLRGIAENSKGGTFTPVQDSDDLSVAFSAALAGLLNVCVEDLTLTVAPLNSSQLNKVNAEYYPQTKQAAVMEPVTVTFRSLYDRETRKVLVNLTLPEVDKRFSVGILRVEFKYRVTGKNEFDSDERIVNVTRTATPKDGEIPRVLAEETRIGTASSIKEARILAFSVALEASHGSQRATTLPAGTPSLNETPMMAEYHKQAKEFEPEEAEAPKQQVGWGLSSMLKQAAAAGISKATEILKEHDPRAANLGNK